MAAGYVRPPHSPGLSPLRRRFEPKSRKDKDCRDLSAPAMTTRVGFLRAVNLGKRTVKMAHLVAIVEGLGHDSVWTHINSGNVVFDAIGSRVDLEHGLEAALEAGLGFEVTTFVRTPAELKAAVAAK